MTALDNAVVETKALLDGPVGQVAGLEDLLPFWDFFQEMIEHNKILIELREQHREICELYQAAVLGEMPGYEYFVVNMPRRTLKTKILQGLAGWTLGEFTDAQLMYGCYSEKLVGQSVRYVAHQVMNRIWYKELYGDLVHTRSNDTVTTVDGGMLYGAGMAATGAGYGAGMKAPGGGYISLDDPANPLGSFSAVQRENTIENFETIWKGCRNSDLWCPIFINAQRIGPEDLPGYVEENYRNKTYVLRFPLRIKLGSYKEAADASDPTAVSAFPDAWSLSTLADYEKTRLGRFVVASQFQQQPIALGGNLIPVDEFVRYDPAEAVNMRFEKMVITVDTALKTKEANDDSAAALWGLIQKKAYLVDCVYGKWESPELLERITLFYDKHKSTPGWPRPRIIIEEKAAGTPLLQNLVKNGVPAKGIERDIDKVRRVQSVLPYIETGLCCIPMSIGNADYRPPPWLEFWIKQHAAFTPLMTHAHDDLVDTSADAIDYLLARKLSSWDVLTDKQ